MKSKSNIDKTIKINLKAKEKYPKNTFIILAPEIWKH